MIILEYCNLCVVLNVDNGRPSVMAVNSLRIEVKYVQLWLNNATVANVAQPEIGLWSTCCDVMVMGSLKTVQTTASLQFGVV